MRKTLFSCFKVGVSSLALYFWTEIAARRAWQHSSMFCSNELGDARDMLMFVQPIQRTQEMLGTRRCEHFSEPTTRCGQVLLSRKHRRGRYTFYTCHIKHVACQWRGLRSRVDGRYLPAQPRVRVHCRWRVTPSLSFCLSTHISASRELESSERSAPCGTPEHRLVS